MPFFFFPFQRHREIRLLSRHLQPPSRPACQCKNDVGRIGTCTHTTPNVEKNMVQSIGFFQTGGGIYMVCTRGGKKRAFGAVSHTSESASSDTPRPSNISSSTSAPPRRPAEIQQHACSSRGDIQCKHNKSNPSSSQAFHPPHALYNSNSSTPSRHYTHTQTTRAALQWG